MSKKIVVKGLWKTIFKELKKKKKIKFKGFKQLEDIWNYDRN